MFKCFFIKKRLYDYVDNALSETENFKVKEHLKTCLSCQKRVGQMESLLKLAESKSAPLPKEEFWHNFKIELDRRLNVRLVPEFKFKPHLAYQLKPVLAYASVLIIILGIIYLSNFSTKSIQLTQSDSELVNETMILEELESELSFNHNEEAYLDELDLLDQLESSPT